MKEFWTDNKGQVINQYNIKLITLFLNYNNDNIMYLVKQIIQLYPFQQRGQRSGFKYLFFLWKLNICGGFWKNLTKIMSI